MYCDIFQKESLYRKVWQSWQAATWRSTLDSSKNCPYKVLVELAMDSWRRVNRPDLVTRVQAADWDMMGLWIGSRDQSDDSFCSCWNLLGFVWIVCTLHVKMFWRFMPYYYWFLVAIRAKSHQCNQSTSYVLCWACSLGFLQDYQRSVTCFPELEVGLQQALTTRYFHGWEMMHAWMVCVFLLHDLEIIESKRASNERREP